MRITFKLLKKIKFEMYENWLRKSNKFNILLGGN